MRPPLFPPLALPEVRNPDGARAAVRAVLPSAIVTERNLGIAGMEYEISDTERGYVGRYVNDWGAALRFEAAPPCRCGRTRHPTADFCALCRQARNARDMRRHQATQNDPWKPSYEYDRQRVPVNRPLARFFASADPHPSVVFEDVPYALDPPAGNILSAPGNVESVNTYPANVGGGETA